MVTFVNESLFFNIMDTNIDKLFNPHIEFPKGIDNFTNVKVDAYHHTLSFDVPGYDVQLIRKYYEGNFRVHKTSEDYIRLYYLLLYLYEVSGANVEIGYSEMSKVIDCSDDTVMKLMARMEDYGLALKDKRDWAESVISGKQSSFKYEIRCLDDLVLSEEDAEKRTKNLSRKRYRYRVNNIEKYIDIDRFIDNLNNLINFSIICRNSHNNELNTNILNTILSNNESVADTLNENVHYIANYSTITINPAQLAQRNDIDIQTRKELIKCVRNWSKNPTVGSDNRIYHAFHRFPSRLRPICLSYNNSPLNEISDIHNAYYVFMCKLIENDSELQHRPEFQSEIQRFEKLVMSGKFYETIRDAVIPYVSTTFKDADDLNKKYNRERIKQELQSYRNEKPGRMKSRFPAIDSWFETNFPCVRDFLRDYPKQENGKKYLQRDISTVETHVMTSICKELHETYNVTPFPLHDAIFLSDHDNDILKASNVNIDTLVLKYLDLKYYKA